MKIGIIQGRLLPPVEGLIQEFPITNWENDSYPPGEGGVDFLLILKTLSKLCYKNIYTLQTCRTTGSELETINSDLEYFNKLYHTL